MNNAHARVMKLNAPSRNNFQFITQLSLFLHAQTIVVIHTNNCRGNLSMKLACGDANIVGTICSSCCFVAATDGIKDKRQKRNWSRPDHPVFVYSRLQIIIVPVENDLCSETIKSRGLITIDIRWLQVSDGEATLNCSKHYLYCSATFAQGKRRTDRRRNTGWKRMERRKKYITMLSSLSSSAVETSGSPCLQSPLKGGRLGSALFPKNAP